MNQERLYKILVGPVATEKATIAAEKGNQVVFNVIPDATKQEIKEAVGKLFNVTVEQVRVLNRKGKTGFNRLTGGPSKRKDVRKAYVRLAAGQDIDFQSID